MCFLQCKTKNIFFFTHFYQCLFTWTWQVNILTAVFYVSDVKKIREQHFDFDFLIHSSGSQPLCDGFSPLFPFKWAIIWQWLTESFCHVLNYIFSDCICIYGGVSIYIYIYTHTGWWFQHLWKIWVIWDDDSIPNCFWKVIQFHGSSHHQPVYMISSEYIRTKSTLCQWGDSGRHRGTCTVGSHDAVAMALKRRRKSRKGDLDRNIIWLYRGCSIYIHDV